MLSSTRGAETRGQELRTLGQFAVSRTMYTLSAVTLLLSWFLCHCLHIKITPLRLQSVDMIAIGVVAIDMIATVNRVWTAAAISVVLCSVCKVAWSMFHMAAMVLFTKNTKWLCWMLLAEHITV